MDKKGGGLMLNENVLLQDIKSVSLQKTSKFILLPKKGELEFFFWGGKVRIFKSLIIRIYLGGSVD